MSWLASNMVWASLAMVLALLVRRPLAIMLGAGPAYALWLVPAARLLMPPLPSFAAGVPLPSLEVIIPFDQGAGPLVPAAALGSFGSWLVALWLGGAASFLVWQLLGYRRFLERLSLASRSVGGHGGIPLVESAAVEGPLALGLLDRRIVIPADFASRYSPVEQQLALAHEATHHRRGDIWWNLAALIVLALNWFNPIAWFAFRAFREDQELACDAAVAAAAEPDAREDYARALIKSASRPGQIATCPFNHIDQLKRRLRMMNQHRSSRLRLAGGAAAVTLFAGLSATFGSPGLAHPHPESETRSERIIIMNQKGEGGGADRQLHIRRGAQGEVVVPECDPSARTEVNEGSDNQRTRIVLCTQGNLSAAERAERLQHARDRIANDGELSQEHRARISAALDREIARLRGQ